MVLYKRGLIRGMSMRTGRRKMIGHSIYERLEYIENTSTAYIDCELKPKHTFDYEIKTDIITGQGILGCIFNNDTTDFRFFNTKPTNWFDVGSHRIFFKVDTGTPIHIKFGNYFIENLVNKEKVTGVIFDEKMNNAIITNLFLWNIKPSDHSFASTGKIWLLNINDNGKPIRKFIPVKRKSDGVIGMYDLVGRKFYTSPNGVAFTGG